MVTTYVRVASGLLMREMNEKLKHLDLFSGIGGFALGLERAGFEPVAFCEIEEFPRQVLRKHWPDVPIFEDVKELTGEQIEREVGPVDIITAGYPCQPFSLAGKRRGEKDDRHLWPEVARLLAELRPAWFIGENVAGHINMGLDEVLSDLESQGYATRTFVIPACAVDAPHRRDRVWIVANADSRGRAKQKRNLPKSHSKRASINASPSSKDAPNPDNAKRRRGEVGGSSRDGQPSLYGEEGTVADAEDNGLQRVRKLTESNPAGSRQKQPLGNSDESGDVADAISAGQSHSEGRQTSAKRNRSGTADNTGCRSRGGAVWLPEPNVGRVANGVPKRVDRLKGLGNAVVPQIPEILGMAILAVENEQKNLHEF